MDGHIEKNRSDQRKITPWQIPMRSPSLRYPDDLERINSSHVGHGSELRWRDGPHLMGSSNFRISLAKELNVISLEKVADWKVLDFWAIEDTSRDISPPTKA